MDDMLPKGSRDLNGAWCGWFTGTVAGVGLSLAVDVCPWVSLGNCYRQSVWDHSHAIALLADVFLFCV